jgi:two-component system cell cycle sensor histidine kinase/response regulator CckA
MNLLLVEDSGDDAELVLRELRHAGIDPVWTRVETEVDFLAALQQKPDIILSDYSMPRFGGLRALELLRESGLRIPFILISGAMGEDVAVEAMRGGATDYLLKDRLGRLPSSVRRAMEEARLRTGRAHAEAELQESRNRLQLAVTAGRVGLWDWDLVTNKVHFSPEWKLQIGFTDEEIGEDFHELRSRVHPEDLARTVQCINNFLACQDSGFEVEFRLRHKDGNWRNVLVQATEVRTPEAGRTRVLGSQVDVTDWVELQSLALQSQKMEGLGRLAGGIAHDFNNLLTVILGVTDLARLDLKKNDPLRLNLDQIYTAGIRASELTRQLLTFSRRQVMTMKVLNLDKAIQEMEVMLRRLIEKNISLVFEPGENLGRIRAGEGQIQQVVMNLVMNAGDAMPSGGTVVIRTANVTVTGPSSSQFPAVAPGEYVLMSVSDTGTGMDEATRARLFEPFFTTKEPGRGTGLGLATVHGIVRQTGGNIFVQSEPGKGATFRILLPRVPEPAVQVLAPQAKARQGSHGERILVVEDQQALRHLVGAMLQSGGYSVVLAENGAEALRLLEQQSEQVDLLLTDIAMPGMNGRELAARASALRPGLRVLYTSGSADHSISRNGIREDNARFLSKPYTANELALKVREALGAPSLSLP